MGNPVTHTVLTQRKSTKKQPECLSHYFQSVEKFVNDILVSGLLTKCLKQKKSDLKLILIQNVKTRVAVTKMRISCHLLPIESGRYKKIPRVERLCPLCNRSEIGYEFYYLLKCTHSSLSHVRGIFLQSLYSINSNFTNMSCKALFLYIMSMCDQNILNLSASYIENILNCYASEL